MDDKHDTSRLVGKSSTECDTKRQQFIIEDLTKTISHNTIDNQKMNYQKVIQSMSENLKNLTLNSTLPPNLQKIYYLNSQINLILSEYDVIQDSIVFTSQTQMKSMYQRQMIQEKTLIKQDFEAKYLQMIDHSDCAEDIKILENQNRELNLAILKMESEGIEKTKRLEQLKGANSGLQLELAGLMEALRCRKRIILKLKKKLADSANTKILLKSTAAHKVLEPTIHQKMPTEEAYTDDSEPSDLSEPDIPKDYQPKPKWNNKTTPGILTPPLIKSVFYPKNKQPELQSRITTDKNEKSNDKNSVTCKNGKIRDKNLILDKPKLDVTENCFLTQLDHLELESSSNCKTKTATFVKIPPSSILLERLSHRNRKLLPK